MSAYEHAAICKELTDLYTQKNADYGDSYHETYRDEGWAAFRIRLTDKLNRFKTLTREPAEVKDESIRDTLLDLANYAILAIMELDREAEHQRIIRINTINSNPTAAGKLSQLERYIAAALDAKYVSRDSVDDSRVIFWTGKPALNDPYYYAPPAVDFIAACGPDAVQTGLQPGDCIHIRD